MQLFSTIDSALVALEGEFLAEEGQVASAPEEDIAWPR